MSDPVTVARPSASAARLVAAVSTSVVGSPDDAIASSEPTNPWCGTLSMPASVLATMRAPRR